MSEYIIEELSKFLRGDMLSDEFELFFYSNDKFEKFVGRENYLLFMLTAYKNKDAVNATRNKIRIWLSEKLNASCNCSIRENQFTEVGDELKNHFEDTRVYESNGYDLIWFECKKCKQKWFLHIVDEIIFHYSRL